MIYLVIYQVFPSHMSFSTSHVSVPRHSTSFFHVPFSTSFHVSIPDWLEKHSLPCFYKKLTGIDCPGCGAQRAFIELLHGNFHKSLILYPALIPVLLMVVFLVTHLIFKINNGHNFLKILFVFNVLIIAFSYFYKIL